GVDAGCGAARSVSGRLPSAPPERKKLAQRGSSGQGGRSANAGIEPDAVPELTGRVFGAMVRLGADRFRRPRATARAEPPLPSSSPARERAPPCLLGVRGVVGVVSFTSRQHPGRGVRIRNL